MRRSTQSLGRSRPAPPTGWLHDGIKEDTQIDNGDAGPLLMSPVVSYTTLPCAQTQTSQTTSSKDGALPVRED